MFQPSCKKADSWFCENQPRFNLCISLPIVGMTVVLQILTLFQPSYLKAHGWNDDWFHENQLFSYMRVRTRLVSCRFFAQTNRLELGRLMVAQVREGSAHPLNSRGKMKFDFRNYV